MNNRDKPYTFTVPLSAIEQYYWVPCTLDTSLGTYVPLVNLSSWQPPPWQANMTEPVRRPRHQWSAEEDSRLVELAKEHGAKHWTRIANRLNAELYQDNPVRTKGDCKERWKNHLNPDLKRNC